MRCGYAVSVKTCSLCGQHPAVAGQSYCQLCRNEYMREWRKTHPPTDEQRRKDICRSYTAVLIKRGKLIPQPCQECGIEPAQAHHPDYGDPRRIIWLCKDHHRQLHWRLKNAPMFVEEALT
jgi:hypothetical protein